MKSKYKRKLIKALKDKKNQKAALLTIAAVATAASGPKATLLVLIATAINAATEAYS